MIKKIILLMALSIPLSLSAQQFTRQDSLRGSITPERAWWDLQKYELAVQVFPETQKISGKNTVTFTALQKGKVLQIDLQPPMTIDRVLFEGKELDYTSEGNAHFLQLPSPIKKGKRAQCTIFFSGAPRVARRAPWDGGFTWETDSNGKPFIATANQGIGASIWWPNKDHPYDEPDEGVSMAITVPQELVAVGNGRLRKMSYTETTQTFEWEVVNPINNYGVNINVGDYVHFTETYEGEQGSLLMDYWVLRDNKEKAKDQFKQAPMMMEAFEHWFGPYPFYEDSFKLVEVPYLGMEHQSSVTYGNQYMNGYLGSDLSGTGWGMKFDFIIIHEAGHEWFANNITNSDVADMWLHEGFTAYSENLYLDYHFGKEASAAYVIGTRQRIANDRPIIGTYGVNKEGSSDMYYKGANILHTLRQLIEDDEKWRRMLRGLNKTFYHQTVSSEDVENYLSKQSGIDLTEFWQQYLRTTKIPTLEYQVNGDELKFRYTNIVDGFDMPVIVRLNGTETWIYPTSAWKTQPWKATIESVEVKEDFYVLPKPLK
ncbi:M1 family metallopeptidase [Altibacter sp. HG106]|uniref:M1 family metallopeptidase n=1 Tax=Altibacter sp. HG106 TaxID=3023937 RepID=UPI002350AA55|nr:M1 family metallopeptidase [Altibacter sp. HG106]MDC7993796.1 M1 family metallopeptidase [Altibacter sp. HG106]